MRNGAPGSARKRLAGNGDPAVWKCKRCLAPDCWSHRRFCYVCGAPRLQSEQAKPTNRRAQVWNGQRDQPAALPPPQVGTPGAPTPPDKPPPKSIANDDPELTKLLAQVSAAKEFFPEHLEAAQRALADHREKKHQHRLATKPRHFVLITLQRDVQQAKKRVDSAKAVVEDVAAQIGRPRRCSR